MKRHVGLLLAALAAAVSPSCSNAPVQAKNPPPPIVYAPAPAAAADGAPAKPKSAYALDIDPICKMSITTDPVAATSTYEGKTYGFCSAFCKESFDKNPKKILDRLAAAAAKGQTEK